MTEATRLVIGKQVERAFQEKRTVTCDFDWEGRKRSACVSLLPYPLFNREAVIWVSHDTTELQNLRSEADRRADELQLILAAIGDAVIVTDQQERIIHWNPTAERLTGVAVADAVGKEFEQVMPPVLADRLREAFGEDDGETSVGYFEFSTASDERYFQAGRFRYRGEGGCSNQVLVIADVTEMHRLEEAQRRNVLQLQKFLLHSNIVRDCLEILSESDSSKSHAGFDRLIGAISKMQNVRYCGVYRAMGSGTLTLLSRLHENTLLPQTLRSKDFPESSAYLEREDGFFAVLGGTGLPPEVQREMDDFLRERHCEVFVGCRIVLHDATWGVLVILGDHSSIFDRDDLACLESVARAMEFNLQRQQLQQQMNDEAELKKTLFDASPIPMIMISPDFRPLMANTQAKNDLFTWCNEQEFFQKNCFETLCGQVCAPDDCPVKKTLESGKAARAQVERNERVYDITTTPVFKDGKLVFVLEAVVDQTDLIQQRRKEKEISDLLSTIIATLPCMVFVKDYGDGGRYLIANKPVYELAELKIPNIIGKTDEEVFGPEWSGKLKASDDEAMSKGALEYDAAYPLISGELRHMHTYKVKVPRENGRDLLLGISFDVTESQRYRHRLEEKQAELARALEAAQAAERAKSLFLATMSHEIRTPLNAVIGFADILKSSSLSKQEIREYSAGIASSGSALLNLINDILDLSKLEAGGVDLFAGECDFYRLLEEIRAIFRQKMLDKKLKFQVVLEPDHAPVLRLSEQRMRQIFLNLIGNSVKFTEHGSVDCRVTLTRNGSTFDVTIVVEDTGIGISEEMGRKIFDPFVQEAVRGRKANEGTGLGLSIVKRLVDGIGGQLTLESQKGRGSRFTIVLGGLLPVSPAEREFSRPALAPDTEFLRGLRVLLVDDLPLNLKVLSINLRRFGVLCVEETEPEKVFDDLEKNPVDLIMTDLWMPGLSGGELAGRLRASVKWRALPIIAVTADVDAENREGAGLFDAFLHKPVAVAKLVEVIRGALESGRRRDA